MKVLTIKARSVWLFRTSFLNPNGIVIVPLLDSIKQRYSFSTCTPYEQVLKSNGESMKYEYGTFYNSKKLPIEIMITIHGDGLVVDSSASTEDNDEFLGDILSWLSDEYKFSNYKDLPIKKRYLSEIYFTLDNPVKFLSKELESFVNSANKNLNKYNLGTLKVNGVTISNDPGDVKTNVFIRVERELDTSFEENRFFSSAQIPTNEQIKLLKMFEAD